MEATSLGRVSPPDGIGECLVFRSEKTEVKSRKMPYILISKNGTPGENKGIGTRGWLQSAEKKQSARLSNKTNDSPHIF
jgi:hypothetical protein